MLLLLRIRNLALAESLEIELGPGLNVLTGETGAGKSILLEAIALLLGGRAQPSAIRTGAERAEVEAVFDLEGNAGVQQWIRAEGLDSEEGTEELLLRREVLQKGRSRAWVNGRLVTITQLAELGERLANLHGQHQSQSLTESGRQREIFDTFAGLDSLRAEVGTLYGEYRDVAERLASLDTDDRESRQRLDFLEYQIGEIESLGLEEGEEESLRTERDRLVHGELLERNATQVGQLLGEGDGESPSALDLAGQAQQLLGGMIAHDGSLSALGEALDEAVAKLDDVVREIGRYGSRLEHDPARLHEVDERLEAIRRLQRKHGPGIGGILEALDRMKAEARAIANRDSDREEAARQLEIAGRKLLAACEKLSGARQKARAPFAKRIVGSLRDLSIPGARFEVVLLPVRSGGMSVRSAGGDAVQIGPDGSEQVEFQFSANSGEDLRALQDVASGGELSRVLLAMHAMTAEKERVALQVFDEIDSGLSGHAAVRVAHALDTLAQHHQVLCVTHQPTIAAKARHHLLVSKTTAKGRTTTSVRRVEGGERRQELSRLLDGGSSAKSLELAGEMLEIPA